MALLMRALVAWVVMISVDAQMCDQGNECDATEEVALLQRTRTAANLSASATGLSSCPKGVSMGQSSIWAKAKGTHSCVSSAGVRGDTGFACEGDGTSIFVDMSSTDHKIGCFVWETEPECEYSMKKVSKIEFDVEWTGCNGLWMAPIWTFSYPWSPHTNQQGLSGEIDFVEECPVPTVNTNLGCYDAGQGNGCQDSKGWGGRSGSSDGIKHMIMTLNDDGDLNIDVCSGAGISTGSSCKQAASYKNYLNTVYPTKEGRDNTYKFVSDVFNDKAGDGGWGGCKAAQHHSTNCKYAVTNIQIHSKSNSPIFAGKCGVLNPGKSNGHVRLGAAAPTHRDDLAIRTPSPLDGPQGPTRGDNFASEFGAYLSQNEAGEPEAEADETASNGAGEPEAEAEADETASNEAGEREAEAEADETATAS